MKKIVLWIGEWGFFNGLPRALPVDCPRRPDQVWTLPREQRQDRPPDPALVPQHRVNAFLEDPMHDWLWKSGKLHYYSRMMDSPVWVLLVYGRERP